MMGKIVKPGKSFKGCVEYCMLKNRAEVMYGDGVRTEDIRQTVADFDMQRKMNPGLGQAVGHIALAWSPEDVPKLTDELMLGIAQEYLQKMKIRDTQMLIVKHSDTDHPHLHIVYNRVNNQGKTISDSFQRELNVKVAKALTIKYGLYISQGKEQVNRQQLKGKDKIKYELYDAINAASQNVRSMGELQQVLTKQGIGMIYKYKSGSNEIQGISFSKGDMKFKGSEIDRGLSYNHLSESIKERVAQQKVQQQSGIKLPKALGGPVRYQQQALRTSNTIVSSGNSLITALLEQPSLDGQPSMDENLIRNKKKKKGKAQSHEYTIHR